MDNFIAGFIAGFIFGALLAGLPLAVWIYGLNYINAMKSRNEKAPK